MHVWIRIFGLLSLSLFISTVTFADTVSVEKDGSGNFLTIQAALESLDYNNGVDDVVLVGPGLFDQQLTANGDAGADSFPIQMYPIYYLLPSRPRSPATLIT